MHRDKEIQREGEREREREQKERVLLYVTLERMQACCWQCGQVSQSFASAPADHGQ